MRLAKKTLALAQASSEIAALIYLGILLTEAEIVFFVNELAQLGSRNRRGSRLVVKLVARKVLQAWNAVASFLKWLAGKIAGDSRLPGRSPSSSSSRPGWARHSTGKRGGLAPI